MNQVGVAHVATMFFLTLVTAIVYSINMQGWRAGEDLGRAILRRSLKIFSLMFYLGVIVWALSETGGAQGTARYLYMGIAAVLCLGILFLIFLPGVFETILGNAAHGGNPDEDDDSANETANGAT